MAALEALVDPLTRGDPTSPLRWTCKSRAKLTAALTEQGWRVHDFPTDTGGKAIPYGVYDMARNEAWVSISR